MAKARKISAESAEPITLTKTTQMTLASLRLEGITLSAESIADLQSVEAGKLSQKEAIARVLARVQK
jgi:hypothetical protein